MNALTLDIVDDGTGNELQANYNWVMWMGSQRVATGRVIGYPRTADRRDLVKAIKQATYTRLGEPDGEAPGFYQYPA